jgi:chemotaxis response regulator CheB
MDDEPIARQILREELNLMDDIDLIGEAHDGKEALRKIVDLQPDLVFLDLQMPLIDGFEVVRRLSGTHLPVIVRNGYFATPAPVANKATGRNRTMAGAESLTTKCLVMVR